MASPGMIQSGLSRELFENWCTDKRNGVIIAGYCVEGTLAKQILSQPTEVPTMSGQMLPLKCSVEYISFSAHTDFQQTSEFLRALKPHHVVRIHIVLFIYYVADTQTFEVNISEHRISMGRLRLHILARPAHMLSVMCLATAVFFKVSGLHSQINFVQLFIYSIRLVLISTLCSERFSKVVKCEGIVCSQAFPLSLSCSCVVF